MSPPGLIIIALRDLWIWLEGNWVVLLSLVLMIGFLYFFAALFLDLPLPFTQQHDPEESDHP